MYFMVIFLFMCLCIFSIYTIYKILEIEKDIETLYDNYSKELEKNIRINVNMRGGRSA